MLTKVLLTSRSAAAIHALQAAFAGQDEFECHTHVLTNGHADPLYNLGWTPDLVVLRFDVEHTAEISAWADHLESRPPLIVIGPAGNVDAVRLAMRSGARDFLPEPVRRSELLATIKRVRDESAKRGAKPAGALTAFVGAAGGVGTSLIATNIAQMLASGANLKTALVDLDLNFAPLPHLLDLHPQHGLLEALDVADTLDAHALSGYSATHKSGLRLIASTSKRAVLTKDVSVEHLSTLLSALRTHHSHVVIDAPHVLDALNAMVFGAATSVYVVLQQSVLHVRNAARLAKILREELGIAKDKVRFVMNRYAKDATVTLDDAQRALDTAQIYAIPSHYKSALQSIDAGMPLYETAPGTPVARGLIQIYGELSGQKPEARGSNFLKRALPSFMRD